MRLSTLSAFACMIVSAIAQSSSTANPPTVDSTFSVTAGKPSTFTWKPTTDGTVTLTLRSGAASDLNKGTVIASKIQNSGSYTFTLPTDTTRNSDYTIQIASDSDPSAVNYTPQFVVESSNTVASITPSANTVSSAATATASSMASSASSMASSMTGASSASSATPAASSATRASNAASSNTSSMTMSSKTESETAGSTSASSSSAVPAPSNGGEVRKAGLGLAAVMVGAVALL